MLKLPVLTAQDCGAEITQENAKALQLNMLRALARCCEENGLRYYLSGGTLLGAIRHQGYIPWDDDIDVNMPRPDCEKLLSLTQGKLGKYLLLGPDMHGADPCCESLRLYDTSAIIENWAGGSAKEPRYIPLFIDIFPIEGLPESFWKTKLHYSRIVLARKLQRLSSLKHMEGSNFLAHLFHIAAWVPAKAVGYFRWSRSIQRIATRYNFDKRDYVGVMTAPVHTLCEKVCKTDYLPQIRVNFEGEQFFAPANYDTYLTQLYGNYMELPPPEKRRSHHVFRVFHNNRYQNV